MGGGVRASLPGDGLRCWRLPRPQLRVQRAHPEVMKAGAEPAGGLLGWLPAPSPRLDPRVRRKGDETKNKCSLGEMEGCLPVRGPVKKRVPV